MTISMRVLPRFPARITATDGLTVVRDGTDVVVKQDFGSLIRIPSVDDADKVFFIAWNSDENLYSIMSFTDTFAAVIDRTGLMSEAVYDPQNIHADAFARANHTGTQAQSTVVNLVADLALKAPLASPGLTGNPTAPTQAALNNSTRLATTAYVDTADAVVLAAAAAARSASDCRLSLSGGNLLLSRFNGTRLTINGTPQAIPQAGVTLVATGLTPSTLYYIYAFMSGGTMTLEASATAPAVDATTGISIKTADATRTLVGMAYPETGPVFTDTAKKRFVRSWFNDPGIRLQNNFTANRATSSPHTTPQEVHSEIRCQFLLWSGERVEAVSAGSFFNGNANGGQTAALGFNTTTTPEDVGVIAIIAASEVSPFSVGALKEGLSEGLNYVTLMGWVSASGGATFYGDVNGRRTSLRCSVLR